MKYIKSLFDVSMLLLLTYLVWMGVSVILRRRWAC